MLRLNPIQDRSFKEPSNHAKVSPKDWANSRLIRPFPLPNLPPQATLKTFVKKRVKLTEKAYKDPYLSRPDPYLPISRHHRQKHSKHVANHDLAVLSSMFAKAVEWGARKDNPSKDVKKFRVEPRDRYVDDPEVLELMKIASPFINSYLSLQLLTGLRKSELLSINLTDVREDGLHVTRKKEGGLAIYEWTDDLRKAVKDAETCHGRVKGLYLFSTRQGEPYIKEDGSTSGATPFGSGS